MFLPGTAGSNQHGSLPTDFDLGLHHAGVGLGFAQASVPPVQQSDPLDQLERLAKLHREGLLTDDEFARQKAMLLER